MLTNLHIPNLYFNYLPQYAAFILEKHLIAFTQYQLAKSREVKVPILMAFKDWPEEELFQFSMQQSKEHLTYLAANNAKGLITDNAERFINNGLPQIKQEDVKAEDITLISYVRKQALLHFITNYSNDVTRVLDLIKEIDLYLLELETVSTNIYISLLNTRINEHAHLIEKINNTMPGALYVFDAVHTKGIYSNNKLKSIIGYTHDDLNALGKNAISTLLHPDDQLDTARAIEEMKAGEDGTISTYKYRIKDKSGSYRWVRNYESVFKRDEKGNIAQTIGIILDIDKEQKLADELERRERQLLEAQDIAQIKSFTWNVGDYSYITPSQSKKLEAIGFESFSSLLSKVHPADKLRVEEAIETAIKETGKIECEYRYQEDEVEKVAWLRGLVVYDQGKPMSFNGTVMDITNRQRMLEELRASESRYKQAEALTHIGNYSWDIQTNNLQWSDELYRIYGLDPAKQDIQYSELETYTQPEDVKMAQEEMQKAITSLQPFDFYYRIKSKDGQQKILHTQGDIVVDENKVPIRVLGTAQDVTEKQALIRKLKQSESLYKQAEALARMGNWSWDLVNNKVDWTDQLFTIYGLAPQSEEVTIERFLSFVHPADRKEVENSMLPQATSSFVDRTFRIITDAGEEKVLHSIAQAHKSENGKIISVIGTEQDITEHQKLVEDLTYSQSLYKQAESLANIGSWSWDMAADKIIWTDELYRIFGLNAATGKINFEKYTSLIHPNDKEALLACISNAMQHQQPYEITHRIALEDGTIRTIHSKGEALLDAEGKPYKLIGTAQDVTEKQQLINNLERNEALYKQAQELANLGNWTYYLKTQTIQWSDELYKIYNVPKGQEITFDYFLSFVHPDDKDPLLQYFEQCIEKRLPYDRKHRIVLGNGTIKTLHRKGEVKFDAAGEAIEIFGTTQDITQQQAIENELKENQTFIQKITDATPSIITSYNINTGKYVFISEGVKKLLGYEPEVVLKEGVSFFVEHTHPDDIAALMKKNESALAEANNNPELNDIVVEFTYRMRHNNGHYRWFHTYGTIFDRNSDHKVEHILNISLDVTEQVEARMKIEEQEHFIQQIADASPTILYLFETTTDSISYINNEIFYVLDYSPDEIIGSGSAVTKLLYHPEEYNLLPERRHSNKSFEHQNSMMQYECRMKHKNGTWCWLLVREIIFKKDDKGAVQQILGAALDITQRKEMEKTLLQNSFQLEQSNASLEEFAYVASHDLKEPLRKIATFGDRIVNTQLERLTDDGKTYIKKIIDASHRMQIMITDLLSVSMISGDRSFQPYSLGLILDDALQALEHKIEQKEAVVEADKLPEANVVPSQFRQLFQNIVSNSLKFVPDGVKPHIRIKHTYLQPSELKHLQIKKAARYHCLQIIDNGIGFEEEYAGKIFTIFQRLHGRSEYEGTGIGLAICKKIVEHHAGVIFANSQPGDGAVFTIVLPEQ